MVQQTACKKSSSILRKKRKASGALDKDEADRIRYPWSQGQVRNTMKLNRSFIESEDDSKINWSPNAAAMYAVVNKDTPNRMGEYPGYRISPGQ